MREARLILNLTRGDGVPMADPVRYRAWIVDEFGGYTCTHGVRAFKGTVTEPVIIFDITADWNNRLEQTLYHIAQSFAAEFGQACVYMRLQSGNVMLVRPVKETWTYQTETTNSPAETRK